MSRNQVTCTITSNLVSRFFRDFAREFNPDNLTEELRKLSGISSRIESWNYLDDGIGEKRKVTVLCFGCPTQMYINLYQ